MSLPPPKLEVEGVIYKGPWRKPESYVKTLLQLDVMDPRYRRTKEGTKCNFLVHDAARLCDAAIPRIGDWPMLANDMVDYWKGNKDWQEAVWQDAVSSALLGYFTAAGLQEPGHGHVSVILPSPTAVGPSSILSMQAGASNFYGKTLPYGYGNKLKDVKFYIHP